MIRAYINERKSGEQKTFTQIGMPLFQKVQNRHLKRRWRIKQNYVAGIYSREELRCELKGAQLQVLSDFTEAVEILINRLEKSKSGLGAA